MCRVTLGRVTLGLINMTNHCKVTDENTRGECSKDDLNTNK